PHLERDGVVAGRVVEDQAPDGAVLLGKHLRGDRLVEHGFSSPVKSLSALRGEKEGPIAQRWEGEVGVGGRSGIPHLTPILSAPGAEREDRYSTLLVRKSAISDLL